MWAEPYTLNPEQLMGHTASRAHRERDNKVDGTVLGLPGRAGAGGILAQHGAHIAGEEPSHLHHHVARDEQSLMYRHPWG